MIHQRERRDWGAGMRQRSVRSTCLAGKKGRSLRVGAEIVGNRAIGMGSTRRQVAF